MTEDGYLQEFNDGLSRWFKIQHYFSNPYHSEFEYVFNEGETIEFEFIFVNSKDDSVKICEIFKIKNLTEYEVKIDCEIKEIVNNKKYDNYYSYGLIDVKEEYRNIGVMSILMLKTIIPLIKAKQDESFCFYLRNTSNVFEDKDMNFKFYDSILNMNYNNIQYRIFTVEKRQKDIEELERLLLKKVTSIKKFFKNKL